MKMKIIVALQGLMIICLVFILVKCRILNNVANDGLYIVFNKSLNIGDSVFYECEFPIKAEVIGKQIGKTTENQQVFEVKGMNKNECICLMDKSGEKLFWNGKKKEIKSILDLEISKIEVRDYQDIETKIEIIESNTIKLMENQMNEKNLVDKEVDYYADEVKELILYSDKYKGLNYLCYYIIDQEGNGYVYDAYQGDMWKMIIPIFEQN